MGKHISVAVIFFILLWVFGGQAADTVRVAAIRVQFVPDDAPTTTGDGRFDLTTSDDPFQIDPPPHNRFYFEDHLQFLKNYFLKVSRGQLVVEGTVFPVAVDSAYALPQPMTYYNPNREPELNHQRYAELLRDAVLTADADPDVDLSQYHTVIVFHAGVGKDVNLGFDETPQDIPSFYLSTEFLRTYLGTNGIALPSGAVVTSGILLPETESQAGIELGLNGMVVANFASYLGMLDLFDPHTGNSGVGRFGLMDAGLFNGDGLLPALPVAWHRVQMGWEEAQTILTAQDDEFPIFHVLSPTGPRVYKFPINENEYFLVENRYAGNKNVDSLKYEMSAAAGKIVNVKEVLLTHLPDAAVFSDRGVLIDVDNPDRGLPGSGVLIWHVDETVIAAKRSVNAINEDIHHRGIDLEEADGSQDIGQVFDFFSAGAGSELGTPLDMWYAGNSAPLFANTFSPNSVPNSRSYYNRANSHITLQNFSQPGPQMTFEAHLNIFQQGFPIRLPHDSTEVTRSLRVADVSGDGIPEMIVLSNRGNIRLISGQGTSLWTFNFEPLVQVYPETIAPLPLFPLKGDVAFAAIERGGRGKIIRLDRNTRQAVTEFTFQVSDSITTQVIAYRPWNADNSFPDGVTLGDGAVIYFGGRSGKVYRVQQEPGGWEVSTVFQIDAPVQYLQVGFPDDIWAVSNTGSVVLNGQEVGNFQQIPLSRPVGFDPWVILPEEIALLPNLDTRIRLPEGFQFARGLAVPASLQWEETPVVGLVDGVVVIEPSASVKENFPKFLYRPAKQVPFDFQPLILPGERADERILVLADSTGLIHAIRWTDGQAMMDFPLYAGDRLAVPPAAADLDGDGDVELAAITRSHGVYVWDLPYSLNTRQAWQYWLQEGGTMGNENHFPLEGNFVKGNETEFSAQLLPEARAYCWPNPVRGGEVKIRYWLRENADVRVDIYDLSGDKITSFVGPGTGGAVNETGWRVDDLPSGVYVARVEARSHQTSETEVRLIKIAVIK